jgi:hypothetical protein
MARGVTKRARSGAKVRRTSHSKLRTRVQKVEIAREWEKGSLLHNYANLGLATDVNAAIPTLVSTGTKRRGVTALTALEPPAKAAKSSKSSSSSAAHDEEEDVADLEEAADELREVPMSGRRSVCSKPRKDKTALVTEWSKIDQATALTGHGTQAARRPKFYMSEEECAYIEPLIKRYGADYEAMFRDIKLNAFQQTKAWLKRNVERYNNYQATLAAERAA